jgi:hypothetical protein
VSALAAVVATVVLAGVGVVQVLAASGAPVGRLVWGGRHRTLPTRLRIGSAVSLVVYAGIAVVLLGRPGMLPGVGGPFVEVAAWVFFAYFAVGVVMNGLSRSIPERAVMTPVCLVLAIASFIVAAGW